MSRWARFRSNEGHVGFGLVEGIAAGTRVVRDPTAQLADGARIAAKTLSK